MARPRPGPCGRRASAPGPESARMRKPMPARDEAACASAPALSAPRRVLPVIVLAQFAGTSLWFAVNAVMPDLQREWGPPAAVGTLTSSVQLGFIVGTLVFALMAVADRHSPRSCSLPARPGRALCNAGRSPRAVVRRAARPALRHRFLLAGIYPVGMKIAARWFPQGLGAALGWLVGALVLGTATPHLLRALGAQWPWQGVIRRRGSGFAAAGGDGLCRSYPTGRTAAPARLQWRALGALGRIAACGRRARLLRPHVGAVHAVGAGAGHRRHAAGGGGRHPPPSW